MKKKKMDSKKTVITFLMMAFGFVAIVFGAMAVKNAQNLNPSAAGMRPTTIGQADRGTNLALNKLESNLEKLEEISQGDAEADTAMILSLVRQGMSNQRTVENMLIAQAQSQNNNIELSLRFQEILLRQEEVFSELVDVVPAQAKNQVNEAIKNTNQGLGLVRTMFGISN